jgi:hypothetical protein
MAQLWSVVGLTATALTAVAATAWVVPRLNKPAFFPTVDYTKADTQEAINLLQEHPDKRMRDCVAQAKKFFGLWDTAFDLYRPDDGPDDGEDQVLVDLANDLVDYRRGNNSKITKVSFFAFEDARNEGRSVYLMGKLEPVSLQSWFQRVLQSLGFSARQHQRIHATVSEHEAYWRMQFEVMRLATPLDTANWVGNPNLKAKDYPNVKFTNLLQLFVVPLGDVGSKDPSSTHMFTGRATPRPYCYYPSEFWRLQMYLADMNDKDGYPRDLIGNLPVDRVHAEFTKTIQAFNRDLAQDCANNRHNYKR